jgi:organic radical activating enzyme
MVLQVVQASWLEPLRRRTTGQLLVHEIYRSIQGESTFAGLPCVFVRLTACSARCVWCDTPHAFNEGDPFSIDDVLEKVLSFGCPLVELTGGEPLLQKEALVLMTRLADAGLTVLLATSGTVSIDGVDPRVHIIKQGMSVVSGQWSVVGSFIAPRGPGTSRLTTDYGPLTTARKVKWHGRVRDDTISGGRACAFRPSRGK